MSIQYSSSNINILFEHTLYRSGCGKNIRTPPWTSGAIPRVSTRLSLSVENEQTDTRRDGQICLTKPNPQAWTGTRNFSLFSWPWTGLASLPSTLACCRGTSGLFVAGTLRGSLFPVCYGSVGVQLTWPRALCPDTLTSQCVQKNLTKFVRYLTKIRFVVIARCWWCWMQNIIASHGNSGPRNHVSCIYFNLMQCNILSRTIFLLRRRSSMRYIPRSNLFYI